MGGDNRATMERFAAAMTSGGMSALTSFIPEGTTPDFVQEWPQSGERIVGQEAALKLGEMYESSTGTHPRMTFGRMTGMGDTYVVEGTIDYGDGVPVRYVGIAELKDGRITHVTEYFAYPFEAPEWRAKFVQRMEPAGV